MSATQTSFGRLRLELPVQDVLGHRAVVVRVGRARGTSASSWRRSRAAHQPGHGVDAAGLAPRDQLGVDARAAVAGLDLAVDGLDRDDQGLAPLRPAARRPPPPGVVAAGGDAQDPAHQPDRPSARGGPR